MAVASLKRSTLKLLTKYNSMLAGNSTAGDYELISTTVVGAGGVASVTFSNLATLAASYKQLQVRIVARSDRSASNNDSLMGRVNSDTGSNYSRHGLSGNGTSSGSGGVASQSSFYLGDFTASTGTTSAFGAFVYDLLDFQSTSKNKVFRALSGYAANEKDVRLASGVWLSTSAVTDISFFANGGNLVQYSRFSLYGLKG
jgi:hypothetical protein